MSKYTTAAEQFIIKGLRMARNRKVLTEAEEAQLVGEIQTVKRVAYNDGLDQALAAAKAVYDPKTPWDEGSAGKEIIRRIEALRIPAQSVQEGDK